MQSCALLPLHWLTLPASVEHVVGMPRQRPSTWFPGQPPWLSSGRLQTRLSAHVVFATPPHFTDVRAGHATPAAPGLTFAPNMLATAAFQYVMLSQPQTGLRIPLPVP